MKRFGGYFANKTLLITHQWNLPGKNESPDGKLLIQSKGCSGDFLLPHQFEITIEHTPNTKRRIPVMLWFLRLMVPHPPPSRRRAGGDGNEYSRCRERLSLLTQWTGSWLLCIPAAHTYIEWHVGFDRLQEAASKLKTGLFITAIKMRFDWVKINAWTLEVFDVSGLLPSSNNHQVQD